MKHYIKNLSAALALLAPMSLMAIERDYGTYLISSANDLMEYVQIVNAGERETYARLTADIDTRPLGDKFVPIGTAEYPYDGTFDGANHTITIALVSTHDCYGLFPYLCGGGHVTNLHVDGTLEVWHNNVGGLVGLLSAFAVVERCISSVDITVKSGRYVGGLIGWSNGIYTPPYTRIENCIYTGHIMGHTDFTCCGIVGWCDYGNEGHTVIKNCLVTGMVDVEIPTIGGLNHIIAGGELSTYESDRGKNVLMYANVSNCYYVNACEPGEQWGATQITMDQVRSGEACYLMNVMEYQWGGAVRQNLYRQNIGEDEYPVFDEMHGVVAKIGPMGYGTWAGGYFNNGLGEYCNARVAEGVNAYAGTINGHTLQLHPVEVMNGANGNGYVIEGNPGYCSFMPTNEPFTNVENDLQGGNSVVDVRYGTYYILGVRDDVVGFYRVPNYGDALDSHIAYLHNPYLDADVDVITMTYDDGTGIVDVESSTSDVHSPIYDLSGRRVGKATKGVHIIKGKKVLK